MVPCKGHGEFSVGLLELIIFNKADICLFFSLISPFNIAIWSISPCRVPGFVKLDPLFSIKSDLCCNKMLISFFTSAKINFEYLYIWLLHIEYWYVIANHQVLLNFNKVILLSTSCNKKSVRSVPQLHEEVIILTLTFSIPPLSWTLLTNFSIVLFFSSSVLKITPSLFLT